MVELVRCPNCGHWNPPDREKCFLCEDKVDPTAVPKPSRKRKQKAASRGTEAAAGSSAPEDGKPTFPLVPVLGIVGLLVVAAVVFFVLRSTGADGEGGARGLLGPSDTQAPTLTRLDPVPDSVVAPGSVSLKGSADENLARATVDGSPATVTGTGFEAVVDLAEGDAVLELVLEDAAGNASTETVRFTVMTVPEGLEYEGRTEEGLHRFTSSRVPELVLVKIPGGTFEMGSPSGGQGDERPVHSVTLSPYWMARTETTNAAWARYVADGGGAAPADPGWSGDYADYFNAQPEGPVLNVNWDQARGFCRWLGLDLPTEEQWAFAARGEGSLLYPWGDVAPDADGVWRAVHEPVDDGYRWTAPVGSFPAGDSPFGLSDMAGNVWEWTADGFTNYPSGPVSDPPVDPGNRKVLRGGSWTSSAQDIRSANRWNQPTSRRGNNIGFRCALASTPEGGE